MRQKNFEYINTIMTHVVCKWPDIRISTTDLRIGTSYMYLRIGTTDLINLCANAYIRPLVCNSLWLVITLSIFLQVCITIARGTTRKIKKIQSLGALVYCAAPLRPQSAALLARAPRFSSKRRALYLYATERRAFS